MTTTFQSALSSGDYDLLRGTTGNNPWYGRQFITLCKNTVVFAGQVVTAPASVTSVAKFAYTSVSVGAYSDTEAGETIFISHTNNIRDAFWRGRARKAADATYVYINETSVNLTVGDYFWVLYDFDVWDVLSRMVGNTQYWDYDLSFHPLAPVANGLQTAYVAWNPDDSAMRVVFDVRASFAADEYSTSSLSYQFTFVAGTYSVYAGSLSSPLCTVDFDANTEQWGKLVVTDSQGTTTTRRFYIRVHGSLDEPALDFTGAQITGDLDSGWNATVSAWSGVSSTLNQTFTVIWSQEYYNGTEGPLSISNNVDMVGRFHTEEIHGAGDALYGYVTDVRFEVEGIAAELARLEMQDLTTIDKGTAAAVDEISFNTPQRSIVYYWQTHCTVLSLCDLTFPNGFDLTYLFQFVTNQGGNCLDAIKGIAAQWNASVEFAPDGRIQVVRDTRYLSDKSGVVVVGDFDNEDFTSIDSLSVEPIQKTGKIDADGISYNSGVSNPFLSRAPGNAQGYAGGSSSLSAQILAATSNTILAQRELNYRSGQLFAIENLTYQQAWKAAHGGYHFLIPSRGQRVTHTYGTATNPRGYSFGTTDYWQVVSISITHDNQTGAREVTTNEELEPPVGDPGDTVPQIAGGTQNNEIVLTPTDPFPNLPDNPGNYLPDDPTPPVYPPLVPPRSGETVIYTDGSLVDTSRSVMTRRSPVWTGATPTDLGSFEVKDVSFDRTTPSPPIGAYLVASDGTDSAIWYTSDAFASPVVWTQGATFSGVYTQIRSAGTAGSVLVYNTDSSSVPTTYNFLLNNGGWSLSSFAWGTNGSYSTGTGWISSCNGGVDKYQQVGITLSIASATLTKVRVTYTKTLGPGPAQQDGIAVNSFGTSLLSVPSTSNTGGVFEWLGSQAGVTDIEVTMVAGVDLSGSCPVAGNVTITAIEIDTGGGNGGVRYSSDYGATVGSAIDLGSSPGGAGGFDLEPIGGASIAAANAQVKLATTLGGSYSDAPGGTLSAGQPVSLAIPYRRLPHGAVQYSASDPDYILGSSAIISSSCLWDVDGTTGTTTNINPASGAVCIGPNLLTIWQSSSVRKLAVVVNVSGVYKAYVWDGAAWSFSKTVTNPVYLRCRRNDPNGTQLYLLDGSTLYVSQNWGVSWLADSTPSTNVSIGLDSYY